MLQTERSNNYQLALKLAIQEQLKYLWTTLPGQIVTYRVDPNDPFAGTADIQITITVSVQQEDGTQVVTKLPLLRDVPVVMPAGGGFDFSIPLKPGDNVVVQFGDRGIDNWWAYGGVQPQTGRRVHDLSDGFAFPAPRTRVTIPGTARVPGLPLSADNLQIRTVDGGTMIEMEPGGDLSKIKATAPGGVYINGVKFIGGDVILNPDTAQAISMLTHTHGGIWPGSAQTEPPTEGS